MISALRITLEEAMMHGVNEFKLQDSSEKPITSLFTIARQNKAISKEARRQLERFWGSVHLERVFVEEEYVSAKRFTRSIMQSINDRSRSKQG